MDRMRGWMGFVTAVVMSGLAVLAGSCQSSYGGGYRGSARGAGRPMPIMGRGAASVPQLASFLLDANPQADAKEVLTLAEVYVEEARIEGLNESVNLYDSPMTWWQRVRTNNPLERFIRTLRLRLRPMGGFHDEPAIESRLRATLGRDRIELTDNARYYQTEVRS